MITTPEAILYLAMNEFEIFTEEATGIVHIGDLGRDGRRRPVPPEVLEAIHSAPHIVAEFARGVFFPASDSLISLLKADGERSADWIEARHTPEAIASAIALGRVQKTARGTYIFTPPPPGQVQEVPAADRGSERDAPISEVHTKETPPGQGETAPWITIPEELLRYRKRGTAA